MKRFITILLYSITPFVGNAQSPVFAWVTQMGQTHNDQGLGVAVDLSGNVYTTGKMGYNAFISKHNNAGNLIWLKQMTGTSYLNNAAGAAITLDPSGNILATGLFTGVVDFDPGPGINNLTGISNHQFICKLDGAGNFIWTKQVGGSIHGDNVYVTSIAIDLQGNVYTTGSIDGPGIDFDPGPGTYILSSANHWDEIFVSKLDASGNFVWAKQMFETPGGMASHGSWGTSITVDVSGNVYSTGRFANTVDFNPGLAAFDLHHTTDWCDTYISKLNANGDFVWAKQLKGQYFDAASWGSSIATDASGNVYTTGSCSDSVDMDPGPGTYYFNGGGGYILKLNAAGNFLSAIPVGGKSLILDSFGNMYLTGTLSDTTDFDPGPGIFALIPLGTYNACVFKLNPSGGFLWAKQMGGSSDTWSQSIALDTSRNIFTAGSFRDTTDFDPDLPVYNLVSTNADDVYVHKLTQCATSTSSYINATACSNYTLNGQTYNASGVYTQTLLNATGCDSIITLHLTIPTINTSVNIATCKSYIWNNQSLNASGTYKDTLVASNGCDSIVTLHLIITAINTSVNLTTCKSYTWNNQLLNVSGTYKDTLVASDGCDSIVTLNLTISPPLTSNITRSICSGQSYLGHSTSGTYVDTLINTNGCDTIRTLHLTVLPKPSPDLGPGGLLCAGDSIVIYPGQFLSYTWQDGSTQSHFTVRQPGTYTVMVRIACDSATAAVTITANICDVYFPSAFSPDGDGKNELFKVIGGLNFKEYHLTVYNRWGQKVFETNDPTKGWDGNYKAHAQRPAVFVWSCEFIKLGDLMERKMSGTVLLMR